MRADDGYAGFDSIGNSDGDALEDGFARALRDAAGLAPEGSLYTLAAEASRRGRRRRNRQRGLLAGGLVVALAAASAVSFGGGGGTAAPPAGERGRSMTSEEAVKLVASMLPSGSTRAEQADTPGTAGPDGNRHRTEGSLLFDDGQGESLLSYAVEYTSQTPDGSAVCMDGWQTPQDSCERTVLPDGSAVVIDKLRDRNDPGRLEWRATWAAPDGRRIVVIEHNGLPDRATRAEPPLGASRLSTLVTKPEWSRLFDALPRLDRAPTSPPTSPPAEPERPTEAQMVAMLPKFAALLPPGAKYTKAKGAPGFVLQVTYQGRTSLVSVILGPAGERGLKDREYATSPGSAGPLAVREQLPGGALVVTNQHGNGKTSTDPILYWSAEAYYPDGRSVRVHEHNGENGYTARPGTPALSPEQLKAIAVSPTWNS